MLLDTRPGEPGREYMSIRGVRVEKGVPVPKTHQQGKWKTVLDALDVGDSFVHSKRVKLDGKAKIPGKEFTSRRLSDGKFRMWRTK